jgi:hypothetical protein
MDAKDNSSAYFARAISSACKMFIKLTKDCFKLKDDFEGGLEGQVAEAEAGNTTNESNLEAAMLVFQ